jgi:hypothetical protein
VEGEDGEEKILNGETGVQDFWASMSTDPLVKVKEIWDASLYYGAEESLHYIAYKRGIPSCAFCS